MHHFRGGQPSVDDFIHLFPPGGRLVAAAIERRLPELAHPSVEAQHRGQVARHRVLAVIPAHHRTQPFPSSGNGLVQSIPEFLFDLPELRAHPLADRLPEHDVFASGSGHVTDGGEPEEAEGFRFTLSPSFAFHRRWAAELDESGLFRMKTQIELYETLPQLG